MGLSAGVLSLNTFAIFQETIPSVMTYPSQETLNLFLE